MAWPLVSSSDHGVTSQSDSVGFGLALVWSRNVHQIAVMASRTTKLVLACSGTLYALGQSVASVALEVPTPYPDPDSPTVTIVTSAGSSTSENGPMLVALSNDDSLTHYFDLDAQPSAQSARDRLVRMLRDEAMRS